MLSVALTGNIGAGKSTVVDLFRRWGATIIDVDQLVREVQVPGHPALAAIAEQFGNEVLQQDGTLNRARLRAKVLAQPAELKALNRIMHPLVHLRRQNLLAEARKRGDRIVVSDIPLLFEAADPAEFDLIVLVDAPESVRRGRLLATRALDNDQISRLMASQLPSATKRARSDYIIDNAGSLEALEHSAASVWQAMLARA
ncbi:MAG TPA: dephospho-CoA kinase [Gemmatimonadales bacterium]